MLTKKEYYTNVCLIHKRGTIIVTKRKNHSTPSKGIRIFGKLFTNSNY